MNEMKIHGKRGIEFKNVDIDIYPQLKFLRIFTSKENLEEIKSKFEDTDLRVIELTPAGTLVYTMGEFDYPSRYYLLRFKDPMEIKLVSKLERIL